MAFQSNGGGALNEINITPLVDVMLVLLVVFMVTTPIIAEEMVQRKVEIDLPSTNAVPVQKSDMRTMVVLYPDYRVMLDLGEGPSLLVACPPTPKDMSIQSKCIDDLKVKLEKNPKLSTDMTIFFLADRSLPYGFTVDVLSQIKGAGYTKLGMVTNPPEGQGG